MRMKFREDKTTQAAARLLSRSRGSMKHMRLIKLLYLIDRKALIKWGRPVTFDMYVNMRYGQVLSITLNLIHEKADPRTGQTGYWREFISREKGNHVELRKNAPTDQLSPAEEQLIDEIYSDFGHLTEWQLVAYCHRLPEWQDPGRSSQSIDVRDILRAGGHGDEEIQAIEDALEGEALADRLIGG